MSLVPRHVRRAVLPALLLGIGPAVPALAVAPAAERVLPIQRAAAGVGESGAAAAAQSATGGKVVGVRLSGDVYEVTVLLANGQVRIVRVDAVSGRVVGG